MVINSSPIESGVLKESLESTDFAGDFANPGREDRPRIRWWLPSPYLTKAGLEHDIRSMKEAGFGGAEVITMPHYDATGKMRVEWGSAFWNEMSRFILQTAEKYEFTIDFTMSPFWPLALPGIESPKEQKQGAQVEAAGAYVDGIDQEHPWKGRIPIPARAVKKAAATGACPRLVAVTYARYLDKDKKILAYDSAQKLDISKEAIIDGQDALTREICFMPPCTGEYVLFGWWEYPSGDKTCGNYQLDHYGEYGTQALINFWEKDLLPEYGKYFSNVTAMFIDSLEYRTHLDWTWGFLELFEQERGYDIAPYLPALYDSDNTFGNFCAFPEPDFCFDKCSAQLLRDYYECLTRLYVKNHLEPLVRFCRRHGVQMRYQTAYGKSLELAQTAMYVDIPETETLYGADILDFYRLQAGALHLTQKRIYSIEASAEKEGRGNGTSNSGNYQQTFHNQLWHLGRAMSCGVNQAVFHGYAYEGFYDGEGNEKGYMPGICWPGYAPGGIEDFSNNWNSVSPNWIHMKGYTDFLARNQAVLRRGKPRVDLAVYRHSYQETIDFRGAKKLYEDGGLLEQSGYSYDFVGPRALEPEEVFVSERQLAKEQVGYRALIFDHVESLPAEIAKRLPDYAKAGLALIFIGSVPKTSAFCREESLSWLEPALKGYENVRILKERCEVVPTLLKWGIYPRAYYQKPAKVLASCRETKEGMLFYFFNYGDKDAYWPAQAGQGERFSVSMEGGGVPCLCDAWDGRIGRLFYREASGRVEVELDLQAQESCVVLLDRTGRVAQQAQKAANVCTTKQEVLRLFPWNLELECYSEGEAAGESINRKVYYEGLERLLPWKSLGEPYASGIGVYSTTFSLEAAPEDDVDYEIDLPEICDSFSMEINGTPLFPNQHHHRISIGSWLRKGTNHLQIQVASPLLNAFLGYAKEHPGKKLLGRQEARQPESYGIWGEVKLYKVRIMPDENAAEAAE